MSRESSFSPEENLIPTGLPGGFFIYNADEGEEICFAEQNVIELFGCSSMAEFREYTGNSFKGMVHPEDLESIENAIQAQTLTGDKRHDYVRYRIITKKGDVRYIEDFGHLLHGSDGRKYFYVYIVDVDRDEYFNQSKNSFAEAQIYSMNQNTDRLTGLLNMNSFYEEVGKLLEKDPGERPALTFLHFDVKNFKIFNENYGFARGDDLLCRIARTLRSEFPDSFISRFSNDHFVVCTEAEDVTDRVKRVHTSVLTILENIHVEINTGIYYLDDSCREVGIACDHARLACGTVKKRYDLIYGVYKSEMYETLRLQQYVEDHIDEAVEKEYLRVFYQPVIRVKSGKICGYEALARWLDPQKGFLAPNQFISTLEEAHTIHKVDTFIIKKVCEDICSLIQKGEPVVPVSINLSRLDFELCDIFGIMEHFRQQYDVPRNMIDIEITESALNDDEGSMLKVIDRFRSTGYHIWIDDFGSGYSSLNHLLDYDFDVLKLDMEFMRTYDRDKRTGKLIHHIVQGAEDIGASPLQEGVETAEHMNLLRSIGCERAQGYYFSKPMTLAESREYTRSKGLEWEVSYFY